ncbi:hypothetical protein M404DRAFT_33691 [Pisolithus tinctorius Marx 270]|uniref:Uncharacterized protein n=1 Tax=Pisolithus tinctorius Marx 270 TaxID=870435 RepID=A0A0C3NK43_PISTI|nr:hypothetical protein M404DRAFT_33691 [Pisolithus tinctorius Marx 270]
MSASCAPHLSQLICTATPNPIKVEKAALKAKFIAVAAALVAEAKCMLDDREDLWEEKGKVFPLVECGRELDVNTKIDMADGPVVAEVDEAYEWWVVEEIAWLKVDKDVQMEEEASQGVKGQGMSAAEPVVSVRMTHVEVPQLVCKQSQQAIAEGNDDDKPKITIPLGSTERQDMQQVMKMKQRCEKSNKGTGKKVQARASVAQLTKALKAGPSKWAHDNDDDNDDDMEVVKTHAHGKGKALVHGRFDGKTALDISQALGMVRAEAMAVHAANLRLQVRIKQLVEALAKLGVE